MKDFKRKWVKSALGAAVAAASVFVASTSAMAAAPETRINGTNTQTLELQGLLGGAGISINGDAEIESSVASVHQGSIIDGANVQSVEWTGGRVLGIDVLGGTIVGAINGDACGKLSVGSVGSSTCSQGDQHMTKSANGGG